MLVIDENAGVTVTGVPVPVIRPLTSTVNGVTVVALSLNVAEVLGAINTPVSVSPSVQERFPTKDWAIPPPVIPLPVAIVTVREVGVYVVVSSDHVSAAVFLRSPDVPVKSAIAFKSASYA